MSETKVLAIDLIVLDAELQGREAIDPDHVADLRGAWRANGNAVPPLKVFFDGTTYWLSDGYHRWHAAKEEKRGSVPCIVVQGTKREAWLDALKANQGHGLRRSNADKRKLVTAALNDAELVKWSNRKIAEHIGVTDPFVSGVRNELLTVSSSPAAQTANDPKEGRDGKKRKAAAKPKAAKKKKPDDPKPAGPLNDEPEPDLTFEEQVKRDNSAIESFCRGLTAHFKDNCPKLLSIDYMGRYDSALKQVEAACSTLRTCKYQDKPCPKCKGEGCETCSRESDYGAVSVLTYRQIAG